jgi:long-chain acyl-CoA synthetase
MNPNLADLLRGHAIGNPDAPCLSYAGETLSYQQLDARSNRVANALLAAGVPRGGRVAIVARNSAVFYELACACAKAGAVMLPINWRLSAREVAGILDDAEPALILADTEFTELLPASAAVKLITVDGDYPLWRDAAAAVDPAVEVEPNDVALLLYTSGTTGQPKGVMISHHNLFHSALMARQIWGFKPASVNLVAMPLFHIGGMGYGLMALTQGGHTVLMQQPEPTAVLETIQRYRVSHAFFVPAVIQSLVSVAAVDSMDLDSLELMVYGASPISEALLLRAIEVFGCGFSHAYGLTETAGTVITLMPEDHDPGGAQAARLRSCGRPVAWVEAGLFDPDSNQQVAQGEVGEIWIRSGMNMLGYWNRPAETAATVSDDGWLRTGDAAYQDTDGYYYIHDRYKDMIVSGGENVYPTEIENVLYEHPGVAETAVIGVPHPRWGETPRAVIVPNAGAELLAEDIIAFVRKRLAHYKCPTSVEFVDVLPRSASGKILKRELRAVAAQPIGGQHE